MLGNNKNPDKKISEIPKKPPSSSLFGKSSNTSSNTISNKTTSEKTNIDSFQKTNKATRGTGPLMADSNMDLTSSPKIDRTYTETHHEDGVTIIKYNTPQKIDNLIEDAKNRVGKEESRFFSNGWIIGKELAKIAPDGMSITFYPREVADLVQELIGYSNFEDNNV
ncbi:MAG: hypothetical protein KatS3mg068_0677 [Candidatus Sericytochromatia bacterium]|nr:MAG: hypothetical protein KatS3mg068_0677 [Candidatus Sericytochromatia bacterium]